MAGQLLVSSSEYWKEVESVAQQAVEDGDDTGEVVFELLDGHNFLIYTGKAFAVLWWSENEEALFDELGEETFDTWSGAIESMAYYAMRADVFDRMSRMD